MSNMEKVTEFLTKAKTFYFLTTDGDQPRGRPFSFFDVKDGRLVFGTGAHKDVCKQMEKNPKVEVLASNGAKFLRMDGTVEFFEDAAFAAAVREKYPYMSKLYNEETGLKQVFFYLNGVRVQIINGFTLVEEFAI